MMRGTSKGSKREEQEIQQGGRSGTILTMRALSRHALLRFGKVKEGLGLQCESPAGEEAKVGDGCGCQGERKAKDDGLHG